MVGSNVYGLSFVLETDHKPLITISKKNLSDMTPRIQRLMMKLQRYDYNMIYTPGKQLLMADALSRATGQTKHPVSSSETEVSVHVDLVLSQIPASDEQLTKIAAETSQDPMLNKVIRCLDNEWPKNSCKQYYPFRDELSVVNGILLKANRIVVPVSMRNEMLERIHDGHMHGH